MDPLELNQHQWWHVKTGLKAGFIDFPTACHYEAAQTKPVRDLLALSLFPWRAYHELHHRHPHRVAARITAEARIKPWLPVILLPDFDKARILNQLQQLDPPLPQLRLRATPRALQGGRSDASPGSAGQPTERPRPR